MGKHEFKKKIQIHVEQPKLNFTGICMLVNCNDCFNDFVEAPTHLYLLNTVMKLFKRTPRFVLNKLCVMFLTQIYM